MAALWGPNPVHPMGAAYHVMAEHIEKDLANSKVKNPPPPPREARIPKRPQLNLSLERADWVRGCSAASARSDLLPPPNKGDEARGGNAQSGSGEPKAEAFLEVSPTVQAEGVAAMGARSSVATGPYIPDEEAVLVMDDHAGGGGSF